MTRVRIVVSLCLLIATAQAATAAPRPARAVHRQGPLMRTKSGYDATVIVRKNGHVTYRQTYPGYINGFPPPAFLYYGYPQSGFTHGVGF